MNKHLIKVEVIEDYIKENNLTKTAFCRLCGISLQQLRNLRKISRVKLTTVTKIADATNLKLDFMVGRKTPTEKRKKPE